MATSLPVVSAKDGFGLVKSGKFRNFLLAGPPGVGKTTWAFMVADLLKKQAWKIQHHAEYSVPEMIGMWVPEKTSFRWEPGPLDLAYNSGGVLIHDEIIEASGPVKTFLIGVFDNGRGGKISYVGRDFVPQPGMINIATMNGWPYEGALHPALLDRIDATIIVLQPGPKQYALLEPDLREMCQDSYEKARDPMIGPPLTFRIFMAYQSLRKYLPVEQAAFAAVHGNEKLAHAFCEALALGSTDDDLDDDLDDDEEEDDD